MKLQAVQKVAEVHSVQGNTQGLATATPAS